MVEGDKGFTSPEPAMVQGSLDLSLLALEMVFGNEAAVDLRRCVPLLGRSVGIAGHDGINDGPERVEHSRRSRLDILDRLANDVAADIPRQGQPGGAAERRPVERVQGAPCGRHAMGDAVAPLRTGRRGLQDSTDLVLDICDRLASSVINVRDPIPGRFQLTECGIQLPGVHLPDQ